MNIDPVIQATDTAVDVQHQFYSKSYWMVQWTNLIHFNLDAIFFAI